MARRYLGKTARCGLDEFTKGQQNSTRNAATAKPWVTDRQMGDYYYYYYHYHHHHCSTIIIIISVIIVIIIINFDYRIIPKCIRAAEGSITDTVGIDCRARTL